MKDTLYRKENQYAFPYGIVLMDGELKGKLPKTLFFYEKRGPLEFPYTFGEHELLKSLMKNYIDFIVEMLAGISLLFMSEDRLESRLLAESQEELGDDQLY